MIEMLKQIWDSCFSMLCGILEENVSNILRNGINLKSTLETLERDFRSLNNKAFDIAEKIKEAELSGKKKRNREVEEWLEEVKLIENEIHTLERQVQTEGFLRKFLTGNEATQLSIRVNKLVEQSRHFGELLVDVSKKRGEPLLTTNLSGKMFKENLERIEKFLKSDKSSIGIYGMGGAGKTALAKHINNIILEKYQENRVCWITVSQDFSIKKLQDKIAHFVDLDLSDEDNEDKRAARLNRAIGNKFILILDDVWEKIYLEKLGDPLHLEGCRLILTTRSSEVCCQMGCQEKVEVEKLHTYEAWDLFEQVLKQDIALAPEIEEIAKNMVKVCDGLPLAIIVLAGSITGETSIEVWRNVLDKLRDPSMVQDDEEDKVFKVLKYSFDRLGENQKRCFLRCSLYPEDFLIQTRQLVNEFISEELVDKRKSRRSQLDQGHAILNKLVKICLLERVSIHQVKMHDLVRAMALKITKRKYMVISDSWSLKEILIKGEWTRDLEKVSLMNNDMIEIPDGMSLDCPKLTTLILSGNPFLKFIPDSFFSKLGNLCFLDLSCTGIEKLPNSLSNLEKLKALNLQGCLCLVDIPDLGKLKKLRELDLSFTRIEKVPQGMEELANLRFLSLIFAQSLKTLPEGLFLNFPLLQCLRLPYTMKAPVEEIVSLKCLEGFDGRVENVSDLSKYFTYGKSQFLDIFHILVVGEDDELLSECGRSTDYRSFGHQLNQVKVCGCDLKNEDLSMLVQDIPSLTLTMCEGLSNSLLDAFARLSKPSPLKVLEICECNRMRKLGLSSSAIPIIEEIKIGRCNELEEIIEVPPPPQAIVFSSLQFLHISECKRMRKLGLPSSAIPNIEEIRIGRCNELEEIIEVPPPPQAIVFSSLRFLHISDCNRIRKLGLPSSAIPNLERIIIGRCNELEEIIEVPPPPQAIVFSSLRFLHILECNRTRKLGLPSSAIPIIEEIKIERCNELEEIIEMPPPPQAIVFSSLRFFHISECNRMRKLGLSSSEIPNLVEINIDRCNELEEIIEVPPPPQAIVFSSLRFLHISECNRMRKLGLPSSAIPNIEEIRIGMCNELEEIIEVPPLPQAIVFFSLRFLHISECNRMRKLGLPSSAIPNIEEIRIGRCNELEEIIEVPPPPQAIVFSSLRFLHISDCNRIRKLGLPSSAIPNLERIIIGRCNELEEIIEVPPPHQAIVFSSLRFLHILECNRMRKLGLPSSAIPIIEEIKIERCNELEEIIEVPPPPQAIVFSSLRFLHISECNRMRKLGLPSSAIPNIEEIKLECAMN